MDEWFPTTGDTQGLQIPRRTEAQNRSQAQAYRSETSRLCEPGRSMSVASSVQEECGLDIAFYGRPLHRPAGAAGEG